MTREGNTEHFQTKVTPVLAERIQRASERAGLKPSQWIRRTIERTLDGGQLQPASRADARPPLPNPADDLRRQIDEMGAGPEPGTPDRPESESHFLPHLVQPDGSCAGGCDPDTDQTCTVGPDDPRRTGKRRRAHPR